MADVNSFFSFKNIVDKTTDADISQTTNYLEAIKAFARITYKSIYVIDYEKKGFEYVSENPLFLCGYTPKEVLDLGYEFYFKNVPEQDLELLLKINTIGFDFYEKIPVEERKDYTISYDFLLKTQEKKTILINQKLTPLFLTAEGKIWKAICIISLSPEQKSGNIRINKNDDNKVFHYNLENDYWETIDKINLSEREKEILQFSIRGYTINDIAKQVFISPDTVKFHRKKLFEKLGVANISEAVAYATINKLI